MEQHRLLNLNGEYVKLYVTTNSTLPRLLKNSGSLVVYHDLYFDKYLGYRNVSFSYKDQAVSNVLIKNGSSKDIQSNILFSSLFKNYIDKVITPYTQNTNDTYDNNQQNTVESKNVPAIQYSRYQNLYSNTGNYLYLGNELIAGGWGFDNETQKDLAIQHLTIIPQYLELFGNILNNEIVFNADEHLEIRNRFKKYIMKDTDLGTLDGDTSGNDKTGLGNKTWLNSNYFPGVFIEDNKNQKIYLRDIPYILEKAQYEDLKINQVVQKCQISFLNIANTSNSSNQIVSNYFINGEGEAHINDGDLIYNDNKHKILYVPIGSSLTNYEIDVVYNAKDSGGIIGTQYYQLINQNTNSENSSIYSSKVQDRINSLDVSDRYYNVTEEVRQQILNKLYSDSVNISMIDELNISTNINQQIINYRLVNSDESIFHYIKWWPFKNEEPSESDIIDNFVTFDEYNAIYKPFKDFKIVVGETLVEGLKNYPIVDSQISQMIYEQSDTSNNSSLQYLKSIENRIYQHNKDIEVFSIIPKYLLYGVTPKQILDNGTTNIIELFNIRFINGKKANESNTYTEKIDISKIIIDENVTIKTELNNLDDGHSFLFAFAIPTIYDIKKIFIRSDNNMWERDITGNFKIISKYNISLNPKQINLAKSAQYNIIYGIYKYTGPETNNKANILIEFNLYENSNLSSSSNTIGNNKINLLDYDNVWKDNTEFLYTDSYNGSHWVDYIFNNDFLVNYISKYCEDTNQDFENYENKYKEKVHTIFS